MAVVYVQGASRGIGFEFVRHFLKRPNTLVVASARTPDVPGLSGISLQNLKKQNQNLDILQIDCTIEDNIVNASKHVEKQYGKLDLLVNSSGILHPSGKGETRLLDVQLDSLVDTFKVNSFVPVLMAKHFSALLQKGTGMIGSQEYKDDNRLNHTGVIVNMSARVGSISDNKLGGWYSYRMSKAALNMANKCLSIELARPKMRIITICLHPGTVDTKLSQPYHRSVPEGKLFTTDYSVSMLLNVIDNISIKDTGKFFGYDGEEIPF